MTEEKPELHGGYDEISDFDSPQNEGSHSEQSMSAEELLATTGYSVPMTTVRAIFQAIEALLSVERTSPVQLSDLEQISDADRRNLLLRATIANPPPDLPRTLIVKKVIADSYDPDDAKAWDSARFLKDWAGAAFLSQVAPDRGHSPKFYGGNRALGFIVLEDLGADHGSLVEPLLGVDIDHAEAALYAFTERIAHMHADTWGHAEAFYAIVDAMNPQLSVEMQEHHAWHERVSKVTTQLQAFDIALSINFEDEMAYLATVVADPGPFAVYRHGDPCPDNFFWQGNQLRLLDFEFGHFGHGLCDLAYGRMNFPTCWCCNRVPPTVIEAMERRYRTILAERYPAIVDDVVFGPAMTDACAIWLMQTLSGLLKTALEEDREWGISTLRPRITAQLAAFIETSASFAHLPAIRNVAEQLLALLEKRWPDLEPLPFYPALRG